MNLWFSTLKYVLTILVWWLLTGKITVSKFCVVNYHNYIVSNFDKNFTSEILMDPYTRVYKIQVILVMLLYIKFYLYSTSF